MSLRYLAVTRSSSRNQDGQQPTSGKAGSRGASPPAKKPSSGRHTPVAGSPPATATLGSAPSLGAAAPSSAGRSAAANGGGAPAPAAAAAAPAPAAAAGTPAQQLSAKLARRAAALCALHFGGGAAGGGAGAALETPGIQALRRACQALQSGGAGDEGAAEGLQQLLSLLSSSSSSSAAAPKAQEGGMAVDAAAPAEEDAISAFELVNSGVVRSLIRYLKGTDLPPGEARRGALRAGVRSLVALPQGRSTARSDSLSFARTPGEGGGARRCIRCRRR